MFPNFGKRIAHLTSPFGEGLLMLDRMSGTEAIGRPFEYQLELIAPVDKLAYTEILGEKVTIELETESLPRFFNGHITSFAYAGFDGRRLGFPQARELPPLPVGRAARHRRTAGDAWRRQAPRFATRLRCSHDWYSFAKKHGAPGGERSTSARCSRRGRIVHHRGLVGRPPLQGEWTRSLGLRFRGARNASRPVP